MRTLQLGVSEGDVCEREGLGDLHGEVSRPGLFDQFGASLQTCFGTCRIASADRREAVGLGASERDDGDDTALVGDQRQRCIDGFVSSGGVESGVDTVRCEFTNAGFEALAVEHRRGAERAHVVLIRCSRSADHGGTACCGELNRNSADATGRAVDEDYVDYYIRVKRREWASYHEQVTPWEVRQYLTLT